MGNPDCQAIQSLPLGLFVCPHATYNMEIGLITPPVGLNLYVINSIAPDLELSTILRGM